MQPDVELLRSIRTFPSLVKYLRDKTKVDLAQYHDNDEELAFFKFYYLLLKEKLSSNNEYYIFLDKKPTRDRHRARALHAYLDSFILWNREKCNIRDFHAIESKENLLIQLSDFIVGLSGFACNKKVPFNKANSQLVQYLKGQLNREELCLITARYGLTRIGTSDRNARYGYEQITKI